MTVQKNETTDVSRKTAIADQIRQADIQIRSADTVIADGKLIQADGNYSIAGLTAKKREAIGFASDPLGAAALRSGWKVVGGISNLRDNAVYGKEQAAAIEKIKIESNQRKHDNSQYDQYRLSNAAKPGGAWDWQNLAPNNGAVKGTEKSITLSPGIILDRFGNENGSYLSPAGSSYDGRALAPGTKAEAYTRYEVLRPLPVESAEVAPAFSSSGGATQFRIKSTADARINVLDLVKNGYLRRLP